MYAEDVLDLLGMLALAVGTALAIFCVVDAGFRYNFSRPNRKAAARLLTLMTPEERKAMLRDGFVWVPGKVDAVGSGWDPRPYWVRIPASLTGTQRSWPPHVAVTGYGVWHSCIVVDWRGHTELRDIPYMDVIISVYLHAKANNWYDFNRCYAKLADKCLDQDVLKTAPIQF